MYKFRRVSDLHKLVDPFRIRHKVYAEEKGWVPVSPTGIEVDAWDVFSKHFCAYEDETAVGTVRMVHNSPLGFPFETSVDIPVGFDREKMYEVSRLAVLEQGRGQRSLLLVGLCRIVWREAAHHGMTSWCAVVDQPVSRLLKRLGFSFLFEGAPIYHLGSISVPLICSMEDSRQALFSRDVDKMLSFHIEEAYRLVEVASV